MIKHYETTQQGIVYGPYGYIGYMGPVQREDLKEVAETFFGLFRWAKRVIMALF